MDIRFKNLLFRLKKDGHLVLVKHPLYDNEQKYRILDTFCGIESAGGSGTGIVNQIDALQTDQLLYLSHNQTPNTLSIVQRSNELEVCSVFQAYDDTNSIRVIQKIKNITTHDICLETAHTIGFYFGNQPDKEKHNWFLHIFRNSRYAESLPHVQSFYDAGMSSHFGLIREYNIGNHSSYDQIPQAIIENKETQDYFMFQIESYYDWYYEIGTSRKMYYLQIGGPNQRFHSWNKTLKPGDTYTTIPVSFCHGKSLNEVLAAMTKYRRHIKPVSPSDKNLPIIFNEYMHLAWDDPFASRTLQVAPKIANIGCDYYVIDCGWHDDVPGVEMYYHFGTWYESKKRFPNGLKNLSNYLHSLGLKFGLWIAPEVVGLKNEKMLSYYGDECFLTRNGKKIRHLTGYLLDYRHPKVIEYMSQTIERLVNEYGVDYIKFDGCPSAGPGTDHACSSLGDGLEEHVLAFLNWTQCMINKYPHVIFEDCAGGGQRLDYKALSLFNLASTSDQTDYLHYPYIIGNIFCSVLPEQAGIWCYPVADADYNAKDESNTNCNVSKECVVSNIVNAILGRIHMASRIYLLDSEKQKLIKEGFDLYQSMVTFKTNAVPYLPKGYTRFDDTFVAVGLRDDATLYLAVWNLYGDKHIKLDLPDIQIAEVSVAYPLELHTDYSYSNNQLTINFTEDIQSRLFKFHLK